MDLLVDWAFDQSTYELYIKSFWISERGFYGRFGCYKGNGKVGQAVYKLLQLNFKINRNY